MVSAMPTFAFPVDRRASGSVEGRRSLDGNGGKRLQRPLACVFGTVCRRRLEGEASSNTCIVEIGEGIFLPAGDALLGSEKNIPAVVGDLKDENRPESFGTFRITIGDKTESAVVPHVYIYGPVDVLWKQGGRRYESDRMAVR